MMHRVSRMRMRHVVHVCHHRSYHFRGLTDSPDVVFRSTKSPKVLQLKSDVETPIKRLASRAFGFKTRDSLLEWNRTETHSDIYQDIPGFLTIERLSTASVESLWTAVSAILPSDPLNASVTTNIGTFHHLSHNFQTSHHLQLGWHLAMSNAPIVPEQLCSDGTNTRFMPGTPQTWPYRLWAGGSIRLDNPLPWRITQGGRIHVTESVINLRIKGQPDPQQAFVTVRKNFIPILDTLDAKDYTQPGLLQALLADPTNTGEGVHARLEQGPAWTEEYTLCFLRDKPDLTSGPTKSIRPPENPKFNHTFVPNRHLLFCWSALTYNAHLIHIDQAFAQQIYGAPNLLVHGPLTLFLVCEWFRRCLTTWALEKQMPEFIMRSIEYRNLQPLYVDESMTLCAKPRYTTPGDLPATWDVWIQKGENESTSMAFKATIKVEREPIPEEEQKRRRLASVFYSARGERSTVLKRNPRAP